MRRFSWIEVSGARDCVQCLALGMESILEREVNLLQGNNASVRFSCSACGFVAVGTVAVDGVEPSYKGPATNKAPSSTTTYNAPSLPDPMETLPEAEQPKSDAEAIARVFGAILPPDEFFECLKQGYPTEVKAENGWVARPRFTPTKVSMGTETVMDVIVEYVHDGATVFERKHSSTEGYPDIEAEKKALWETCVAAIRGPRQTTGLPVPPARQPRGPVNCVSNGWGSEAGVVNEPAGAQDAALRAGLLRSLQGGA